jgi:simple sugar transport system ATP-binding protein
VTTEEGEALTLTRITKHFGSVTVLDAVSFHLRPGTVHALLGENGAGKTTLMRIAFGMVRPDSGTVHAGGRALRLRSPADAIAAGIGMVHQHFTLVPAMSVAENVALGGHGRLHPREAEARVSELGALTGVALEPSALVETLPVGAQQRVEIAKALARRVRVLVLDEPTAVLAPAEAAELLRWLRSFVEAGNAAVLITHKLREALAVADDVTVLRHGRVAHAGSAGGASVESLTSAMLGTERTGREMLAVAPARTGEVVFRAERLALSDPDGRTRIRDASFVVRSGEIVGVAGVEGSGHRELLRALAGRRSITGGKLERPGQVGFIPEDRHHDAVLLDRSLDENVALRDAGTRRGLMRWNAIRVRTEVLMRAFDVRAANVRAPMRTLSGGNQQKLVLARELAPPELPGGVDERAPAIVAENPTRGLDVRATGDVHARLQAARSAGSAVVLYSSDLDEVLALASRVLVVHSGSVREAVPDRNVVGRAMLGLG